jgi:hypothetical protein
MNTTTSKYANRCGYSDVQAHEVVRVVSQRTIEIRRLKATLLNGAGSGESDALRFSPGGFFGHTSGEQRYSFASDESEKVFRIRLGKRGWKSADGARFTLSAEPHEYYDFNF